MHSVRRRRTIAGDIASNFASRTFNGDIGLTLGNFEALGKNFVVETRYEQNKNLYAVMQMEKWVIYGILSLILIVAAFNMIGALTMLVLEKQKDIAVLKAMGSSASLIQKIFITPKGEILVHGEEDELELIEPVQKKAKLKFS